MICKLCEVDKSEEEFYARYKTCKTCICAKQRKRTKRDKLKTRTRQKECNTCSISKPISDFRVNRGSCNDCEKASGRKYRQNTTKAKEWVIQNTDRMKELQARWYQTNKQQINKKRSERYQIDPCFRVWVNQKARLYQTINKSKRTKEYLNSDINEVCTWLEYCMTDKMTWNNHGDIWHIDHVIPIATFDLTNHNDIDRCFNWRNLMPFLKEQNLRKNCRILSNQVQQQIHNLASYSQTSETLEYIDYLLQHTS